MGWANDLSDPLTFPLGDPTNSQISIGTGLNPALTSAGYQAAITFGGNYALIGGTGGGVELAYFPDPDVGPIYILATWQGADAVTGEPSTEFDTDVRIGPTDNENGFNYLLPISNFQIVYPFGSGLSPVRFGTKFTDYTNISTLYAPSGYRIDADGWCNLEGLAYNQSGGAATAGDNVITGLPIPLSGKNQVIPTLNGAGTPMLLQISNTGILSIISGSDPNLQNVCLDKVRYFVGKVGT